MTDDKTNRGRKDEARDPNRPIDPETGEKEGLGRRDQPTTEPTEPTQPETPESNA